ncbi:hemerythrin domain-containing protein [Actinophytocola sp.]|uniref:hemerythrin domain-containing protein n=1 Tax=Actinophytocola sp. TaxID=1872138 RepID=UPI00389AECE1
MSGDVVDLIMQDHREVERLFDELKQHPDKRPLLVPVLASILTAHSRAEEAEVYPAAKKAGEEDEVEHSQHEHAEAEELLAKLVETDPESPDFEPALDELVESVTHHVEEEESSVLPGMRERLDDARREELGRAFAASRAKHMGDMPGQATLAELRQQAANMGVSGASSMSKEQLRRELSHSS